jgi:hypothetical protein
MHQGYKLPNSWKLSEGAFLWVIFVSRLQAYDLFWMRQGYKPLDFFSWVTFSAGCIRHRRDHLPGKVTHFNIYKESCPPRQIREWNISKKKWNLC